MVNRQMPKPVELLELMQFEKPELNLKKRVWLAPPPR